MSSSGAPVVLITREEAEPLASLLRAAGCSHLLHVPLQHLSATHFPPPPGAPAPALVLVTSAEALRLGGEAVVAMLRGVAAVAVGQKTAAALRHAGLKVVAVGSRGGQEAVDLLAQHRHDADRAGAVWYIGAEAPSAEVAGALATWPGPPVLRWAVYRNEVPPEAAAALQAVPEGAVVTFSAASAARRYVALGGRCDGIRVAVIGASTARAAAAAGLSVEAVATAPTLEGLAQAAMALVRI